MENNSNTNDQNIKLACLEYLFIFNPVDTWQHLYQFEDDFADFLAEHNMEARVLDSVNPQGARRIIQINKRSGPIDELVAKLDPPTEFTQVAPPSSKLKAIRRAL